MNTKLSAIIMASVMLVVAFAAALTPSTDSDAAVETVDAQYIIGTENVAYVLPDQQSVTTKVSMNAKAFDGPAFDAKAYRYTTPEFTISNGTPEGEAVIDANFVFTADTSGSGNHTIQFINDSTSFQPGFFLIDVTLVDTINDNFNKVTLHYYYAANIAEAASTMSVVLVKKNSGVTESDEISDSLTFNKDTDYTGTFAKVKVGTGTDAVYLGIDDYDFYESNLPDGIDMKSNGEIAGKIISSAELTEDAEDFTVYAINKNTGKAILKGDFTYTVDDSLSTDYFKYQIAGGEKKIYSTVGYYAMKNDDTLTVTVFDVNGNAITSNTGFTAVYSTDGMTGTGDSAEFSGALKPVDVNNDGTIVLSGLGDYTGVIQLQITKTTSTNSCTAVIHVMLVGPLVHSGLAPTVTSA